jgi:hypothetical protein
MLDRDAMPSESYLAVRCRHCEKQFAFCEENDSATALWVTSGGELVLTCPYCQFPMPYRGESAFPAKLNEA